MIYPSYNSAKELEKYFFLYGLSRLYLSILSILSFSGLWGSGRPELRACGVLLPYIYRHLNNALQTAYQRLASGFSNNTTPPDRALIRRCQHEGELLAMKRLARGFPSPCSNVGRKLVTGDIKGLSLLSAPSTIRHGSSKASRPRTALFFPGM